MVLPSTALGHGAGLEVEGQIRATSLDLGDAPAPTVGELGDGDLDIEVTEKDAPEPAVADEEGEARQPRSSDQQSFPCTGGMAGPFACQNVDLESFVPLGSAGLGNGNDVWGWTDPKTDREYAIVGSALETTFIDVTDPQNPVTKGALPTSGIPDFVLWRDMKVDGNYAFIVSEQTDHGMQVFDLTRLRDAGPIPQVFSADVVYRGVDEDGLRLSNAHNVAINEETDFAYIVGSNTCVSVGAEGENGGLHMVDISKPEEPRFVGCALVNSPAANNYSHDVQCVIYRGPDADYRGREICFGSNESVVAVYDVTNKFSPKVISQWGYPEAEYTHQGWLTPDQRFFLFGDELDEQGDTVEHTTTYIMDALDLDRPKRPKAFAHETRSIDHNLFIKDDLVYAANYGAGLRILKFTQSSLKSGKLNEVGYLDIRPGFDEPEFVGTWSNYPYFDSGIVLFTGIEEGSTVLYVARPTGEAAGRGGQGGQGGGGGGGGEGGGSGGGGEGGGSGGGEGGGGHCDCAQESGGHGAPDDGDDDAVAARGATAEGAALAVTGAWIVGFVLLGLAMICVGAIFRKVAGSPHR